MFEEIKEKIEEEIKKFFSKLNFNFKIEKISLSGKTFEVNLQTKEFRELTGEKGKILNEIQHLLNAILKKKIKEDIFLDLDIDGYKEKKIKYLKELAKSVADEVALTKKEKILEPMPAYERKIIHLELASRSDVITESIGKEPNRRVVIKPYP
jgi:spoIIIJ-associated protein